MRPVVLQVAAMSVDGVISEAGTPLEAYFGALPDDVAHERWLVGSLRRAGVHVVGRQTYLDMAQYFPTVRHEGGESPMTTGAIDDAMNEIPKAVFSSTLCDDEATWADTTIVRGDTLAGLEALRRTGDGEILVHGGARFLRALSVLDAPDEYRLVVAPFVAGAGPRLFDGPLDPRELELVSCEPFANGVLGLTYRRAR